MDLVEILPLSLSSIGLRNMYQANALHVASRGKELTDDPRGSLGA